MNARFNASRVTVRAAPTISLFEVRLLKRHPISPADAFRVDYVYSRTSLSRTVSLLLPHTVNENCYQKPQQICLNADFHQYCIVKFLPHR
jgi:hypothetical protein